MKYRQQPKGHSSCQLISAINARIFLGGCDVPDRDYEEMVDTTKCKNGAAIYIERAFQRLGLKIKNIPISLKAIKNNLPVELPFFDPKKGYHSSLIVDVKGDKLTLVNSTYKTINWNHAEKRIPPCAMREKHLKSYKI